MSDISSFWNADSIGADWEAGNGSLLSGNELQTAVIISLFTDRLAREDDSFEGERRGWWGDSNDEEQLGSRLWLLRRQKLTPEVALKAEEYASEALAWLIKDSVVGAVETASQIIFPNRLNLVIRLQRPGGDSWEEMKFFWIWEQLENAF